MIIRDVDAQGRRRARFLQVPVSIVNDPRVSNMEYRILSRLLLKPDDWKANRAQISRENSINKETASKSINHLAELGYLRPTNTERGERGRFSTIEYDVYEVPFSSISDHDGFTGTVVPERSHRDGKTGSNYI